jgi:hypothetical protein
VSTGLEILAKMERAATLMSRWPSIRIDDVKRFYIIDDYQDQNYFFGSALQHCKHGDAKKYHEMGQRNKTAYRDQFIRRFNSPHPHMAKYKGKNSEVIKTYHALNVAASLGA